jgi:hypothetical protein
MSRADAVIVASAAAALLTAACHQPSPRPAPGCEPEVLAPPPEVAPPLAATESATAVVVAAPPVDLPAAASAPAGVDVDSSVAFADGEHADSASGDDGEAPASAARWSPRFDGKSCDYCEIVEENPPGSQ